MKRRLTVFAPAKLNLYLRVTGTMEDGYHSLETVYQSIDLFDEVYLEVGSTPSGRRNHISWGTVSGQQSQLVPRNRDNLAHEAAREFLRESGLSGVSLRLGLRKRIPVGGGLAGGSTDAAATLHGLNHLFDEALTQEQLLAIGRRLGSDVPFCILGGCMLGTGRGDRLWRLPATSRLVLVLVLPPSDTQLGAGEIYALYRQMGQREPREPSPQKFVQVLLSEGTRISKYLYNSLEESVLARCYWSDTAKSAIESYGYQASVSGSGPSVFTVAPNEHQARDLVSKLRAHGLRAFAHHPSDLACQLVAHEG